MKRGRKGRGPHRCSPALGTREVELAAASMFEGGLLFSIETGGGGGCLCPSPRAWCSVQPSPAADASGDGGVGGVCDGGGVAMISAMAAKRADLVGLHFGPGP